MAVSGEQHEGFPHRSRALFAARADRRSLHRQENQERSFWNILSQNDRPRNIKPFRVCF
jgi:hypothetical protein